MALATSIVVRLLATMIVIAAIGGQLAHLDALSGATLGLANTISSNPRPAFLTLVAADAVVSALAGLLALALVFRGDSARGARGLGVALAAWSYLLAYSGIVLLLRPDPGLLRSLFEAHFPLIEILGLAGLIEFTTIFPRRLQRSDLAPEDSLPIGVRSLQQLRKLLLRPGAPWAAVLVLMVLLFTINTISGGSIADAGLNPFMDLLRFSALALVVLNVRRSWVLASAASRRQMWWVVVGLALLISTLALLIGGNILLATTHWREPTVAWRPILLDLGLLGLLWGAGMAVFYNGKLDSSVVGRRVFSATVLATMTLVVATGLEVLLSTGLVGRISLPPGVGTAIAVLAGTTTYAQSLPLIERILDLVSGAGRERSAEQTL